RGGGPVEPAAAVPRGANSARHGEVRGHGAGAGRRPGAVAAWGDRAGGGGRCIGGADGGAGPLGAVPLGSVAGEHGDPAGGGAYGDDGGPGGDAGAVVPRAGVAGPGSVALTGQAARRIAPMIGPRAMRVSASA